MQAQVTRLLAVFVFAAAALAGTATRADAAFIAYICNSADCSGTAGTDYQIVTDNGAGDSLSGTTGIISMFFPVGDLEVNLNISQSKPLLTDGMDLDWIVTNVSGTSGGTVWLYAADTDFVGPETLYAAVGGTADAGASVTAFMCGGTDNSGPDPLNSNCVSSNSLTSNFFGTSFGPLSATADPYSLAIGVMVTIEDGVNATTSGDLRVTPEPATMGLFGLALLGLGGALRRRSPA